MSAHRLLSWKNRWTTVSIGVVAATGVAAAVIGFVWIPSAQGNGRELNLWDAICTAAGAITPYRLPAAAIATAVQPSDVVVTAQMMRPADALSIGRGATLAMQCTVCHGVRGMSMAGSPNLAGQVDAAVYKQLRDFKTGHRSNAVMAAMVARLDDRAMRDLAAYYAYLPRERLPENQANGVPVPQLVSNGAPMRGIGACASCHGAAAANAATPRLNGEPASYIAAQLNAFATGSRRNDAHLQMRNTARHMTAEEIAVVARYYEAN
jgi:cytochrome c553